MYVEIKSSGQKPPDDKLKVGHQNDGSGAYYPIIANTPHGRIPGKGQCGKGWYSFGGKEHAARDFCFLKCNPGHTVRLQKSNYPPEPGLISGNQKDRGVLYSVLCHQTGHGKIPGKSDGKTAWYSWGSKEHQTSDFSYIVIVPPAPTVHVPLPRRRIVHVPSRAVHVPFTRRQISATKRTSHGPQPQLYPLQPQFPPQSQYFEQQPQYPRQPQFPPQPQVPSQYPPSYPGSIPAYPPAATPQYPPTGSYPAPAPPQGLTNGMKVRFRCTKTNKNLRLTTANEVNGMGGTGTWATFQVHVLGPGQYAFQNEVGNWLSAKGGRCTGSNIYRDPDTFFLVHLNPTDRSLSLECQSSPGWFLAIDVDGSSTFIFGERKPSAKFFPEIVQ